MKTVLIVDRHDLYSYLNIIKMFNQHSVDYYSEVDMMKLIPEVPGKPLLGVIDAFRGEGTPADFMARIGNQYGEIVRFKLLGTTFHLIIDPALVQEVLVKKPKQFPKGKRDVDLLSRIVGRGILTNGDRDSHRMQRRLAQPAFHMRRIATYADTMVAYTEQMAAEWESNGVYDMSEEMDELTLYIVAKTLFDADMESMRGMAHTVGRSIAEMQKMTDENFDKPFTIPSWIPTPRNRKMKRNRAILDDIINGIIAERRAEGNAEGNKDKGDLLSMLALAEYEDGSRMSDEQLRDELVTMFVAGHETTSNGLMWTWYLLSQHSEIMARLQAELDDVLEGRPPTMHDLRDLPYLEMVWKEVLRLYPPAWMLNARETEENVQIGEYIIPKNTFVFVSPYALHHNERIFPDPERFDPERFSAENEPNIPKYGYIPFGAGPSRLHR